MLTKDEIRRAMRQKRRAVSSEMRAAVSHDICTRLLARDDVQAAIRNREVIAVYIATPREIDLTEFIDVVHAQGGRLAAPRWNGHEYEMAEFIPSTSNSQPSTLNPQPSTLNPQLSTLNPQLSTLNLQLNPSSPTPNIPEPPRSIALSLYRSIAPSLYLVPGLAFTREGARLGEGGGWYDRMLAHRQQLTTNHQQLTTLSLLGVAYSFQIVPDLPVEPHDCKLNDVISS